VIKYVKDLKNGHILIMDAAYPDSLKKYLDPLSLSEVRYFKTIGSTNDYCLGWAKEGAVDLSLAVADHQSAGRGRANRKWVTNAGAALAFSLLLRPRGLEFQNLPFFSPLGALAIRRALGRLFKLSAEIKWPNDVLVKGKKLAGILVENVWEGNVLNAIIAGIGINITPASLPPQEQILFPATCVEDETGRPVDRWRLLAAILDEIITWRQKLASDEFFLEWSNHLAFIGERVCISGNLRTDLIGKLIGIDPSGDLIIETDDGRLENIMVGDVRLRAV
jgi:BirA family biotin operon repressor/biotin-[acetyl-CoA-carboxylase] ligase